MPRFRNLFRKRFFGFFFANVSKYYGLNFYFFEGACCKCDIKKNLNICIAKIIRNKKESERGYEIIFKKFEHMTYVTVRIISA